MSNRLAIRAGVIPRPVSGDGDDGVVPFPEARDVDAAFFLDRVPRIDEHGHEDLIELSRPARHLR